MLQSTVDKVRRLFLVNPFTTTSEVAKRAHVSEDSASEIRGQMAQMPMLNPDATLEDRLAAYEAWGRILDEQIAGIEGQVSELKAQRTEVRRRAADIVKSAEQAFREVTPGERLTLKSLQAEEDSLGEQAAPLEDLLDDYHLAREQATAQVTALRKELAAEQYPELQQQFEERTEALILQLRELQPFVTELEQLRQEAIGTAHEAGEQWVFPCPAADAILHAWGLLTRELRLITA